jgi:hypothetical protein
MATTYRASGKVHCWKQHTCAGCGALFRYLFDRTVQGSGPTQDSARVNLQASVKHTLRTEVDQHPCPSCGVFQPEMIGGARKGSHNVMLASAVLSGILAAIFAWKDVLWQPTLGWVMAVALAVFAAVDASQALKNPNGDLGANKRKADEEVAAKKLVLDQAGRGIQPSSAIGAEGRSGRAKVALLLAAAAVLGPIAAEGLRTAAGWPSNPRLYPPVLGPGDSAYLYASDSVSSIKGYWRGDVLVRGSDPKDPKDFGFTASSKDDHWGSSMSVKSSETSNFRTPWARLTAPADPSLAGKTAELLVSIAVTYPRTTGSGGFTDDGRVFNEKASIAVAPVSRAGLVYSLVWWGGLLVGCFLSALGSFRLSDLAEELKPAAPTTCYEAK